MYFGKVLSSIFPGEWSERISTLPNYTLLGMGGESTAAVFLLNGTLQQKDGIAQWTERGEFKDPMNGTVRSVLCVVQFDTIKRLYRTVYMLFFSGECLQTPIGADYSSDAWEAPAPGSLRAGNVQRLLGVQP